MTNYETSWSDVAFGSKKALKDLKATFIAAPRKISRERITQIIKEYLPAGNIVIGLAEELFIDGFEGQARFKTLSLADVNEIIQKVNSSKSPHKIFVLHYHQREICHVFEKINFRLTLLVNGSWSKSFHTRPEYYTLVSRKADFKFISPFCSEAEAVSYAKKHKDARTSVLAGKMLSETEMMMAVKEASRESFDTTFQVGVALGKKMGAKYKLLAAAYNKIVPYQTFAWHFGALREKHLSPPGDLNYYDAVHAESMVLIEAHKRGISLAGTSLFINVLPCPTCARMLCETEIGEVIYSLDHSDGYAVALLEKAGKIVRRIVSPGDIIEERVK